MRIEHGKLEGNQEISAELILHGMISGNATIKKGGVLYLHGMVTGNLIVEEGGTVLLHGMVCGNVSNRGGQLQVYGTIVGKLDRVAGSTYVDPTAKINGGIA